MTSELSQCNPALGSRAFFTLVPNRFYGSDRIASKRKRFGSSGARGELGDDPSHDTQRVLIHPDFQSSLLTKYENSDWVRVWAFLAFSDMGGLQRWFSNCHAKKASVTDKLLLTLPQMVTIHELQSNISLRCSHMKSFIYNWSSLFFT